MMRKSLLTILVYLTAITGAAEAKVYPLVIESSFTNDIWFPLPVEQMKAAAVDTALTEISKTKKFAFLYDYNDQNMKSGMLNLAVTLVEPAEAAKLTIKLNLPENAGTYVSSSSVSLRNKNYKQIFDALQDLGRSAAEQLNLSASEIDSSDAGDDQSDKLSKEIMLLNLSVIELHKSIDNSAAESHNRAIFKRLGKLDTIIEKLDEHHDYVKKNDEVQNRKLDYIYSKLQKLNIGTNTANTTPDGKELSPIDIKYLPDVNAAIQLKYKKDFSGARKILSEIVNAKEISALFRRAVEEELYINLPLFEADIQKNVLGYNFSEQIKGDRYKKSISHIKTLYEAVLKRPDVLFEKRVKIKQKLDELMISAESMGAVIKLTQINELHNLKNMLQDNMSLSMSRRMIMGSSGGDGFCPNDKELETIIRRAHLIVYTFKSMKETDEWCELKLFDEKNNPKQIKFNYDEAYISKIGEKGVGWIVS